MERAWPSIKHAYEDLLVAAVIFNDDKPIMSAGPLSPEAQEALDLLVAAGVPHAEAKKVVETAMQADSRVD